MASPIGDVWLAWQPDGVVMLRFGGPPSEAALRRWAPEGACASVMPAWIAEPLGRYFAGEPVDPTEVPVRIGGTSFQRRVWTALRAVPRGAVTTYAELAHAAGSPKATRAIGMAMGQNPLPIVVPCHRVIAAGGAIGGFTGGLAIKRALLALEGVRVDGDRVHLAQLGLF